MTGLNYQERQRLKELDQKYSYILNNEGLMKLTNGSSHAEEKMEVPQLFIDILSSIDDKVISKD